MKILVKDNSTYKIFKPCNVPYILKVQLEEELERLRGEGILNRSGGICVCSDYKLKVVSHVETYPLPRVEDLFHVYLEVRHSQTCQPFQIKIRDIFNKNEGQISSVFQTFIWGGGGGGGGGGAQEKVNHRKKSITCT